VLRLQKIEMILAKIQEFFNLNGALNDMLGLIKMIVSLTLIAHFIACFWHGVGFFSQGNDTWLDYYGIRGEDNWTKYLYSFYWATMTMATVGYGDITPKSNLERVTASITMFLACGVFAFSINSIGIVLQNLYRNNMEYR
jgi:potassium voltage-gated channel Eag-related subfamily H protein 7